MFATSTILLVICVYMVLLFVIAQIIESRANTPSYRAFQPIIYALAITVYCSSWSFYGSVGVAVESGFMFFAPYAGAIIAVLCWRQILTPMIRAKNVYRITSIADFISARYNRSQLIAALITLIALFGTLPYIALQLKTLIMSYEIIAKPVSFQDDHSMMTGIIITVVMTLFTIMFGARKLDPTERHPGMMGVLAIQCLIKLGAMLALGIYATYYLYQGFGDVFEHIAWGGLGHLLTSTSPQGSSFVQWITFMILGAVAIQCLPRQFHVAVIENSNERHMSVAMWLVPIYLLLMCLFVIPIAAAGILHGVPAGEADMFMIRLPHIVEHENMAMVVFIGGFSAATGMIIISVMALSTMATNHLLMPVIEQAKFLVPLRQHLLPCRWAMIVLILLASYGFLYLFNDTYMLSTMGIISFVAIFQFVPALFCGLFWSHGNKGGALMGLLAGMAVWFYTLVLPGLAQLGVLPQSFVLEGLWGLSWLRPNALFGLEGLSPVTHSVFWSFAFNMSWYVLGSLIYNPSRQERGQVKDFMKALRSGEMSHRARPTGLDTYVELQGKREEGLQLLAEYMPLAKAEQAIANISDHLQVTEKEKITIIELVEFHRLLENVLAGAIGSASAHKTMDRRITYSPRETNDLKAIFNHLKSELVTQNSPANSSGTTADGDQNSYTSIDKLQHTISEQENLINSQQKVLDRALQTRDIADQKLFEQRLVNQKLNQEVKKLRARINEELGESS